MRKKSPTEVIEATPYPEVEHSFYKLPGEEITDNTNYETSTETITRPPPVPDDAEVFTGIHTHPSSLPIIVKHQGIPKNNAEKLLFRLFPGLNEFELTEGYVSIEYGALPSGNDLELFLEDKKEKTTIIAVRDPETGKVRGYTIVSKTKDTPKIDGWSGRLAQDIAEYRNGYKTLDTMHESFEKFVHKYNLNYRLVPVKGYQLNDTKTQFVRKKNLERMVGGTMGIVGLVASMFFLNSEITGNIIGNLTSGTQSTIGMVFFLIGIIGILVYIKKSAS